MGILHQFDAQCTTPKARSGNRRIGLTVSGVDPAAMGAVQIWDGNGLAGRLCRRWLTLFTCSWRDAGQARSLGLAGGLQIRRYRAGLVPAPTVVTADGFAARRGWANGGIDSTPATRRQRGMVFRGALRGESPRTREGRRPDRTELQWSVVRDDGTCAAWGRDLV